MFPWFFGITNRAFRMKTTMRTLRLSPIRLAALVGFALATNAVAQEKAQISVDLRIQITDGKGSEKEYDLSSLAPLRVDLRPWTDLLEGEAGIDEIAQLAKQATRTWADDLMRRLDQRQGATKSWLGVAVQPLPEEVGAQLPQLKGGGLIVRDAAQGSPAAAAGLRPNDVLTRLNDQILFSEEQLTKLIATFAPGDEVGLAWMREGEEMKARATLAAEHRRPSDTAPGGEAAELIDRLLGPGAGAMFEMAASHPDLIVRRILEFDEQGQIRWRDAAVDEVALEIRRHLKAKAPDLVRGFDELILELAPVPDLASVLKRLGGELEKASPQQRERITQLAGEMLMDLSREIEP